jgi:hypothetical protein
MLTVTRLLSAIVVLAILFIGAPAWGEVETFKLDWASIDTFIQPVWSTATTTVTLEPWIAPDGSGTGYHLIGLTGPYAGDFYFRCGSVGPEHCAVAGNFSVPYDGTMVVQRNYAGPGAATLQLDITWAGHQNGRLIGVGVKELAPPPQNPLQVFITEPSAGATVNGTVWVVLRVEGTSGASNVFTLSADGQQIGSETTSSDGPVRIRWPKPVGTTSEGAHTLTGTVVDATGNTGSTSITVIRKK